MFKKTIAMTGAAALLALGLTGCGATLGGGAQSEEAAASADNQLCVFRARRPRSCLRPCPRG